MKKIISLALLMLFAVGISSADISPDKEKAKTEFVQAQDLKLEVKEALKVDDAEYTGYVISKTSLSGVGFLFGAVSLLGMFASIGNLFRRFFKFRNIAMLAFAISLICFLSGNIEAGLVLANAPLVVPDTASDELKAIGKVSDQVEKFKTELGEKADKADFSKVETALNELKTGLKDWSGEKIETKMVEINGLIEKIGTQVEEMREDVAGMKDKGGSQAKAGELFTKEELDKFIKDTFDGSMKTSNKATIKINAAQIFKAAETFGYPQFFAGAAGTVTDAFTGRMIDPTLYQRRRKRNLIIDNFPIETISVPKLIYLEKIEIGASPDSDTDSGGADWIVSGAAKPLRSFRVTTGEAEAKKVAIFGNVEDKLLRDVSSLENWIREDFMAEMMEKYNDALLNNNPAVDADAPLGLKQNAIQYSATTAFNATIPNPTLIDVIIAVSAKLADLKERAGKVFISDDNWYAIHALKDLDARYQNNPLVYTSSLGQLYIAGVAVLAADSEDVPSTHILAVGEDMGFKIKNYGSLVFERGLNGTDFREDKTSFRGYQEVLSYISQHRENSVLYDTIANVTAAISATS